MFKLIKIENSGVNVPEPIALAKYTDTRICIGSALTVVGGKAVNCDTAAAPQYIAYENADESASEVLCYRISGDMLFEVATSAAPTSIAVGDKLTLAEDEDGCIALVSATTGGCAEVVELLGAKVKGDKITVRF